MKFFTPRSCQACFLTSNLRQADVQLHLEIAPLPGFALDLAASWLRSHIGACKTGQHFNKSPAFQRNWGLSVVVSMA